MLFALGCLSFPPEAPYWALDYHIDRPRVLAIQVDPPVLIHGLPVTIDALVLGPEPHDGARIELCGMLEDAPVDVWHSACFAEDSLVSPLADTVPFDWDPPDLSALECDDTFRAGRPAAILSGGRDTGGWDTADTGEWDTGQVPWYDCHTHPLMRVVATFGDEEAHGYLGAPIRLRAWETGEQPPVSLARVERSLEVRGTPAAGASVELVYKVEAEARRFRWYVDAGELRGTGVTAVQDQVGELRITRNHLTIPADHHGPLRVAVVVVGEGGWGEGRVGDMAWDLLTLEVQP